jgi:hypothetical protein
VNKVLSFAFAALSLVALGPGSAQAQSSPFAGKWAIEITAGMRMGDGGAEAIRAKATLVIDETADSLIATLTVDPNPDVPARPPSRFATAKVAGNAATFIRKSEARLHANGTESTATVISTWSLKVDGNALSGDVRSEIEGGMMPSMPAQPVTGTRVP